MNEEKVLTELETTAITKVARDNQTTVTAVYSLFRKRNGSMAKLSRRRISKLALAEAYDSDINRNMELVRLREEDPKKWTYKALGCLYGFSRQRAQEIYLLYRHKTSP